MALTQSPKVATSGLIFYYDALNSQKSWRGKPTTNTCSFGSYNYVWANGTVTRNTTAPVVPPITGYEIAKLQSNDGADTQTILYTASVDQVNGGVYTHSAYIYLESGSWVSVGQHWNPWDYGTQNYIPLKTWTRVSYTLTNSANNYGNIACSYNTNGVIYITATQYEQGFFATPFIGTTRSSTQSLVDMMGNYTLTPNNVTYNSNGTFSFNGSSWFDLNSNNIITGNNPFTVEAWYTTNGTTADEIFGNYGSSSTSGTLWVSGRYGTYINGAVYFPGHPIGAGTYHLATTRNSSGNVILYLNGVQVNSGTLSSSIPVTYNFRIGADVNGGAEPFTGSIHSVKVYNRVLTAAEIQQNFAAQRGRFGI